MTAASSVQASEEGAGITRVPDGSLVVHTLSTWLSAWVWTSTYRVGW